MGIQHHICMIIAAHLKSTRTWNHLQSATHKTGDQNILAVSAFFRLFITLTPSKLITLVCFRFGQLQISVWFIFNSMLQKVQSSPCFTSPLELANALPWVCFSLVDFIPLTEYSDCLASFLRLGNTDSILSLYY